MLNNRKVPDYLVPIMAGLAALLAGVFIYAATRSSQQVFFLQFLPEIHRRFPVNSFLYSLPSFLHVYAFILFTYAVLPKQKNQLRRIFLFWLIVELLFEFGQQHDIALAVTRYLPDWLNHSAWLKTISVYFLRGTFDPVDVLFVFSGALAALGTIIWNDYVLRKKSHCR